MAEERNAIAIEVALAASGEQRLLALKVAPGTHVQEAYWQALEQFDLPEAELIHWRNAPLGCFGHKLRDPATHVLAEGDRIEAYAPLKIDPKAARRARAGQHQDGVSKADSTR